MSPLLLFVLIVTCVYLKTPLSCADNYHYKCKEELYPCKATPTCIPRFKVCNGVSDCVDNSDEPEWCAKHEKCYTAEITCDQLCVDTSHDYRCKCFNGFKINNSSNICEDIDECNDMDNVCNGQKCRNVIGDYECYSETYEEKEDSFILFNDFNTVKKLKLGFYTKYVKQGKVITSADSVNSVEYNWAKNYAIFVNSNFSKSQLQMAQLFHNRPSMIFPTDLYSTYSFIGELAIDWVHNLLYFTDFSNNAIRVLFLGENSSVATVVFKSIKTPISITLNIKESSIFWINNRTSIERALQDGSSRKTLMSGLPWPWSLTIDVKSEIIYWLESGYHSDFHSIYSCDYNGEDKKVILSSVEYLGISTLLQYFDGYLYWKSQKNKSVFKFDLETRNISSVLESKKYSFNEFKIVSQKLQPQYRNRCKSSNCSHICVPHNISCFVCLCPDNFVIKGNSQTCVPVVKSSHGEHKWYPQSDPFCEFDRNEGDKMSLIITVIIVIITLSITILILLCYLKLKNTKRIDMNVVYKH